MSAPKLGPKPSPKSGSTSLPKPRVFLAGATGTIGRATAKALLAKGYEAVCMVRAGPRADALRQAFPGLDIRIGDVSDPHALSDTGLRGEQFDAVISCLASRTGAPKDAWAIDHDANLTLLKAAQDHGIGQFVLLSAICVQKPALAFQRAKLAFEAALQASGLTYSIVRPTAFFKSLSGQLDRLKAGKPFLVFGDGRLTACKPISDDDLAAFLVRCLDDEALQGAIFPIGGPGPAITLREQGEALFALLGKDPHFRQVSPKLLDIIIALLSAAGTLLPAMKDKAELARIGRYYATESMLVWDAKRERYDADATPEFGEETLFAFYEALISGERTIDRGEHAVF